MALINQNSIIGVTSITSPSANNVLTVHTYDTTERLRVTANGVSFSGTNASLDTSGNATFNGNVSIGGTLTYEDVTNIDSVGIVTAQSGIHVTGGSVGIGTDNPQEDLHIGGNSPYILLDDYDNFRKWRLKGTAWFAIEDATAGEDRLRILSSGNIGIGTDNPIRRLHVQSPGSTSNALFGNSENNNSIEVTRTGSTASYFQVQTYTNICNIVGGPTLTFRTSDPIGSASTERLRITSTGAIGIGSDFTAIETTGGGGITLDSGVGGGQIGVFLKSTGYTGNQTKLWQDSANAVSYLEATERPLIIKAGDGSGDYLRVDVAGDERFRIDSYGYVEGHTHPIESGSTIRQQDGSGSGAATGWVAVNSTTWDWDVNQSHYISCTFEGYIQSGTYWWTWRLYNSTRSEVLTPFLGANRLDNTSGYGTIAYIGAVHSYSRQPYVAFKKSASTQTGDTIQLQLHASNGGGSVLYTNPSQTLYARYITFHAGVATGGSTL